MTPHILDMEIELLAASEAELRARVRALEAERDAYRDVLQVALHVAHALTVDRDRLRWQVRELRQAQRGRRVA